MGGMTAGKGDKRRPTFVSDATLEARWRQTFGPRAASSAARRYLEREEAADNHVEGAATRTPTETAQTEQEEA